MSDENKTYDRLLTLWGMHDSLLQWYRNIFLTTQSVIFAVAVFVGGSHGIKAIFPLALVGLVMIRFWLSVCRSRGHDEWYFQWQLLNLEAGKSPSDPLLKGFKEWQALGPEKQRQRLDEDATAKELLTSRTRLVMDTYIPVVFVGAWVVLILVALL